MCISTNSEAREQSEFGAPPAVPGRSQIRSNNYEPAVSWSHFGDGGALEVAANAMCSQAWTMGRTLALQFHPEVTLPIFDRWLETGGQAIVDRLGLDGEAIRTRTRDDEPLARARTKALVDAYLDRVAAREA